LFLGTYSECGELTILYTTGRNLNKQESRLKRELIKESITKKAKFILVQVDVA